MKKLLPALLLLLCLVGRPTVHAQCTNDTLFISTGLNHLSGSLDTLGGLDANWTVLSGPNGTSLSFPSPGWIIPQYSGWYYTQPGSQWLSPFNFASYGANNYTVPYVFRYTFCLGQQTIINMQMHLLCDDLAAVYLDSVYVDSTNSGYRFYQSTIDTMTTTRTLAAGTHYLDVHLYNVGGVAMGLNIQGYITSILGLVTDTCCNVTGCCCGSVYEDHNGDGERDMGTGGAPVDQGVPGWKVAVTGGGHTYNMNTDIFGNYSFVNLTPGSYSLTTSTPAGAPVNTSTVSVGKQNVTQKNVPITASQLVLGVNNVDAEQSYFHAYPNPASSMLQMDYFLAQSAAVSLRIDNIQGQSVLQVLQNENKAGGQYHQTVNIEQLPAGIYFYELNAGKVYKGKFVKQ